MTKVGIPSPLHSYTGKVGSVEADGATLSEILGDLDRRYPGIRFRIVDEQNRIRPHMRIFVNRIAADNLDLEIRDGDEVHILQALSGG